MAGEESQHVAGRLAVSAQEGRSSPLRLVCGSAGCRALLWVDRWAEKSAGRAFVSAAVRSAREEEYLVEGEVERAQADGRWDAAYDPPSRATVPDDLQAALDENSQAKEFFVTLDRANRYAVLFRVQTAKKPETRKRKIAELVEMLSEKRKLHP